MANLRLSADHHWSSTFDLRSPKSVFKGALMKRARKVKVNQRKTTKSQPAPTPQVSQPTWQSVIWEAEEQMARLRRTIERTKKYARSRRLGLTTEPMPFPGDGTQPPRPFFRATDI